LEALGQLVRRDPRLVNIDARLERWAKRLGLAVPETGVVIARALEDLFALGVLDRVAAGDPSLAVRVGARARALWFDGDAKRDDSALRDLGPLRFGVGPSTKIADVLRASAILEPTELGPELGLVVSAERIEQLALAGRTEADLRAWLEPLGAWSTATQALVVDATRARNQLDFAPAAGFVWIEDSALREQLRTQPGLAGLFVDPSPQMGLLVRAGVSLERLVKACRSRSIALRLLDDAGSARLVAENKARKVGRPRQRPAR
jgi:hypothetical protein